MSLSEECFQYFSEIIKKNLGIVYLKENAFQLESRLQELAKKNNFSSVDDLWYTVVRMGASHNLIQDLLDIATNNETLFYRDPHLFEGLKEEVVPYLVEIHGLKDPLRIWSAACSTGQEVYTLALVMQDLNQNQFPTLGYEILGTDISERVLKQAEEGIYTDLEMSRGLSDQEKSRFFDRNPNGTWHVKSELKSRVRFKRNNLLDKWNFDKNFHIIFCRNVLIYQEIESKKNIVNQLYEWLKPGGVLVLGGAESLFGISDKFMNKSYKTAVFFYKKD